MIEISSSTWKAVIQLVGGIVCFGVILFLVIPPRTVVSEGMTNGGEGGSAASFAAGLKAKTVDMQDSLLIDKYRADYEAVLMNLDDYLGALMLKRALNFKPASEEEEGSEEATLASLRAMTDLSSARATLDEAMQYLEGLKTAK